MCFTVLHKWIFAFYEEYYIFQPFIKTMQEKHIMKHILPILLIFASLLSAEPLVGLKRVQEAVPSPSQDVRLRVINDGELIQKSVNQLTINKLHPGDSVVAEADYQYIWFSMSCFKGETLLFVPTGQFEFVVPDHAIAYPKNAFTQQVTINARVASLQDLQTARNVACNPYDFRYRAECGPPNEKMPSDSPIIASGELRAFPHAYANRVTRNEAIFHPRNAIDGIATTGSGHSAFPYQSWGYGQHDDSEFIVYFGRPVVIDRIELVLRADYSGKQKEHDTYWKSADIVFSDGSTETVHPVKGGQPQSFPVTPRKTDSIRLKNLVRAMNDNSENWAALVELQTWGHEADIQENPIAVRRGFRIDPMTEVPLVKTDVLHAADIATVMRNVLSYTKTTFRADGASWEDGVFHIGNIDAFLTTGELDYYLYSRHVAESHRYLVNNGNMTTNGDFYCIGQAYITLAQLAPRPDKLRNIIACTDFNLKRNAVDYHWIDAIFMSNIVYTQLARLTNHPEYIDCEFNSYKTWREKLFDEESGLWYRDSRFVNKRTKQKRKIFWSRGDAWVFAALARQLVYLPNHESDAYRQYEKDFKIMAKALKSCQREDGTWNSSLDDPQHAGGMETTGTCGFLYGFAIGVQYGILDKAEYLPVALKAYNALTTTCQLSPGRIGYMQLGSDSPDNYRNEAFTKTRSNRFGYGLFLLAASALMRMCSDYQPPLLTVPLDFQSQEPSFLRPPRGFYRDKITVTSPNSFQQGNSPDKLCDGKWSDKMGERWSTDTWPAVVNFDFSKELTIKQIAVFPLQARNYAYTMEFSNDGKDWQTVIDRTKPHHGVIIDLFDIPPQTARFARLTVKKAPGCYNGPWISLKEICFYE